MLNQVAVLRLGIFQRLLHFVTQVDVPCKADRANRPVGQNNR